MNKRFRLLAAGIAALASAASLLTSVQPAGGFGTINAAGQRAEHERITRVALACPPGVPSTGECFEPRSMDQVAGRSGTFGAVGSPDSDEIFTAAAHCDDADFLNVAGYPRTRSQATAQLRACVDHLRVRFRQGRDASAALLRADGTVDPGQVDLTSDCTFFLGIPGRAKCNALEGFGRALHGVQDFYSHSNWTDEADPSVPISIDNPPGLNRPAPSGLLNLRDSGTPSIPVDLTTGFFKTTFFVPRDNCPAADGRITHACLNKDKARIGPGGAVSDPQTPRGRVRNNAQNAVTGAIEETRRQWRDFRDELVARFGLGRGTSMILALTRDVP